MPLREKLYKRKEQMLKRTLSFYTHNIFAHNAFSLSLMVNKHQLADIYNPQEPAVLPLILNKHSSLNPILSPAKEFRQSAVFLSS
jgi:hypothetical protein